MDITGRIGYIEGYNHDLVITKDKYLEIYPKCGYNYGNIQKTAKFPVMLCIFETLRGHTFNHIGCAQMRFTAYVA